MVGAALCTRVAKLALGAPRAVCLPWAGCWLLALLLQPFSLLTSPGGRHFPGMGNVWDLQYFCRSPSDVWG